jgi:hypothetical protein
MSANYAPARNSASIARQSIMFLQNIEKPMAQFDAPA